MQDIFKDVKLKNIVMLTIAGIVNSFAVTVFIAPVKLYDSGVSGTALLMSQLTPPSFSLSFFLILLNIPLFLFGLKKQGAQFTFYAIYCVFIYSISAWLITDVLPIDVSIASPLAGRDLLLCSVFGGIISGAGSGLAIRFGGAMDGIDVMAVIFAKKIGVSVGAFVMAYNVALYICAGAIMGSWILPLYSVVTYFAALKTLDFIVEGFERSKAAMIITFKATDICDALTAAFESGATIIPAKGAFSDTNRFVVYFVVNRFQVARMKNIAREIDPLAYITITEVADIFSANIEK